MFWRRHQKRLSWRRCGVTLALAASAIAGLTGIHPVGPDRVYAQKIQKIEQIQNTSGDGWIANDDDSWLLDLRTGKYQLGQGVRGYQTPTGLCVDLGDMILALDLPISLDKKSRRATGWIFSERQTLVVDRDAGRVDYAGRTATLKPDMIRDTPEGWCVAVDTLSAWMGVTLKPDLSNAILTIQSTEKLPFEIQAERRARAASIKPQGRFDLSTMKGVIQPYSAWTTPSIDVVASTSFTKDARSTQGNGEKDRKARANYEIFAAGEVGTISYDARLASDDSGIPATVRVRAYRSDPEAGLLGPLKATHFAVGDVNGFSTALVSQSAIGRGFVVTNRPLEQPDSYDRTNFRGDLPTGWDAELYRNGQLLAFSSGGTGAGGASRYEFLDVPLLYGNNSFEILLYGPQGQIRRETRIVPVGVDALPPGKTWYWAGVVDEGKDLLRIRSFVRPVERGLRGTFGLERGIGPKTAIMAQFHSLVLDRKRRIYGEAALRQAAGPFLADVSLAYANTVSGAAPALGLEDRSGVAVRGQILGELGKTYVRAETIWAASGFESDRVAKGVRGLHSVSLDQTIKLAGAVLPVHFEARYIERSSGGDSLEIGSRVSTTFRNLSMTAQLDWRQTFADFGSNPAADVQISVLANARIGKVRVRGEAALGLSGHSSSDRFSLIAEWGAGGDYRTGGAEWRGELGYDKGLDRARAALSYVRHFKPASVSMTGEVASDGSFGLGLNLAFSLGPNPRTGGLRVTSSKLASQGQVLASVWRDHNADGIWQPDEPAEPDVGITAGTSLSGTPTGADGTTMIDGVAPFRKILIGVDTGSLSDPLLQPAHMGIVVTPRPGVITRIQIPLVPAGEVEGLLVHTGGRTLQGIDLKLVDASGQTRATTRSDYDGYFLFEGVLYGEYQLYIADISGQLARLQTNLDRTVRVNKANPRVQLGTISAATATKGIAAIAPDNDPVSVPTVSGVIATLPATKQDGAQDSAQDNATATAAQGTAPAQRGISFLYWD